MRSPIKIALIALAMGGAALAAGQPAMADHVTIGVDPGGIAFGYSDGYWDRGHAWHAWQNREAANAYRKTNRGHYYEYKHDRDPDQGWREKEHWWDKH